MGNTTLTVRALVDGQDVTRWVTAVSWSQERRTLHREFALTMAGFLHIPPAARWDIYAGYGGAGEVVIRRGIIPPDWQPEVSIGPQDSVPSIAVRGVDWVWLAVRKRHRDTVVLAPDRGQARRAIRIYTERVPGRPVGRTAVLKAATMHEAVTRLGMLAGFQVVILLPDYKLQGHVCDPGQSLWEAIWELVSPFAPMAYFRRERNEVVIADRAHLVAAATTWTLPTSVVTGMSIEPVREANLRRVLVRIPSWVDAEAPR